MKRVFDLDGPVMSALGRVTDFLVLNLIFLVTCIPIITIGPALSALYSVTLKMVKNEDSYILKRYLSAFKENFKISFLAGLLILASIILFAFDYRIMTTMGDSMGTIFPIIFLALIFICLVISMYLFPYIARFENTFKDSFKNTVLIAVASMPWTLLLLLITGVALASIWVIPLQYSILIWFLFGFAVLAYIQSFIFRKVFARYEPKEELKQAEE